MSGVVICCDIELVCIRIGDMDVLLVCSSRSGLVHGTTSVQKGESAVQVNGSSIRGSSKIELEGASYAAGKLDRVDMTERERLNGKPGSKYVFCSGICAIDFCIAMSAELFLIIRRRSWCQV